ncbi:MAG: glycosyl hydrolase family 28-related protein [Bryobacteraceae bacterium]
MARRKLDSLLAPLLPARALLLILVAANACLLAAAQPPAVLHTCVVTAYGATGHKPDLATGAIQSAIDACAASGGGTVFFPPGDYTSGTIRLKSHIRLFLDAGAVLYASLDDKDFALRRKPP